MVAARSHPPTLETLARRLLIDERLVARGDLVLVAVSGGPDSLALLHVLTRLRARLGLRLSAHGVDHGLREEASAELDIAAGLARDLEVTFGRTRCEVAPGGNLLARAREARLHALRAAARASGAQVIATAHHADDRAETVLLRLLQGSGWQGLGCLPPRSGEMIRPLLSARKRDILAHLARHQISFASDPSNQDARFLRTRVRREVMPLLEVLSPKIIEHLNALADDLARERSGRAPESLGRAQRAMAQQAQSRGRSGVRARLKGGEEAWVSLASGRLVITRHGKP